LFSVTPNPILIMAPDKITPTDPRVQHQHILLNGINYHYLLAQPSSNPHATIFLIHGWPDFSHGWRYQIPLLLSLNLRVVVPDMMGYSLTAAPDSVEYYTFKRAANDMAALAAHLNAPKIILLGHDWGGAVVYRIALWHPSLISAVISICTPFARPTKEYIQLEQVVKTVLPNFGYQIQLASGEVEKEVEKMGPDGIRMFLNAMYGGKGPNGEGGFVPEKGLLFENWPLLGPTRLLEPEELDYYTEAYSRHGLRGPLNWYRTRELNFRDEKVLANVKDFKIRCPVLYVGAKRDQALPPSMVRGMERNFEDLTVGEVDAGHWALWQRPEECNRLISGFLERLLGESEREEVEGRTKL
jgi:soluble epoxide hydrolase / lipid-phosphate phosphatase